MGSIIFIITYYVVCYLSGKTNKLVIDKDGEAVTAATRTQSGMIDISNDSVFKNLGVSIPTAFQKKGAAAVGTKFAALEKIALEREATQKSLITELKTIQKARIKEKIISKK